MATGTGYNNNGRTSLTHPDNRVGSLFLRAIVIE
jgi:hypothetical protein